MEPCIDAIVRDYGVTSGLISLSFRVRARAWNSNYVFSDWSEYSDALTYDLSQDIAFTSVISLPQGIKRIEASAFEASDCQYVIVPSGCEEICSRAFANCKSLKYIVIPRGITVASDAFLGSDDVQIIYDE